jgi:hypothetical protein
MCGGRTEEEHGLGKVKRKSKTLERKRGKKKEKKL